MVIETCYEFHLRRCFSARTESLHLDVLCSDPVHENAISQAFLELGLQRHQEPDPALVLSCAYRVGRALARGESSLVKTARKSKNNFRIQFSLPAKKGRNEKVHLSSFRFHYNWGSSSSSSSNIQPSPTRHPYYYNQRWDSVVTLEPGEDNPGKSQLS